MNAHQLLKQAGMLEAYIKTGERCEKDWGLCDNVLMGYYYWKNVFVTWPLYSGCAAFPIEGESFTYCTNRCKHDRRTKYGKLRLSLAEHCLDYVMNELKEAV
tara:strand:+ start:2137 stop:2442 length:306 start_codon:yes stop_codon:yes gene_type:complete